MARERLGPEEDAALRRLHWFETLGCELSNALRALKDSFRSRDRRAEIRDPGATYDPRAEEQAKKDASSYWAQ